MTKAIYINEAAFVDGVVTGATNLGTGNGTIFTTLNNDCIQLKTLSGGTNITLTCNGNYIGINSIGGVSCRENITKLINQASHGFVVGNVIGWSGGTYNKAIANGNYDGEVIGVVSKCYDANCFDLTQSGYVTGLTSLSTNATYFLSPTTAGALSSSEPTVAGQVNKSVLIADSSTSGWVLPYPGYIVTTGTTGGGISWNGSTVGGIGTYIDSSTICSQPKLKFNTTGLHVTGRTYISGITSGQTSCIIYYDLNTKELKYDKLTSGTDGAVQFNNNGVLGGTCLNFDDSLNTFSYGVSPAEQYTNFVINTNGDAYNDGYYFKLKDSYGYYDIINIGIIGDTCGVIQTSDISGMLYSLPSDLNLSGCRVVVKDIFNINQSDSLPLYANGGDMVRTTEGLFIKYASAWNNLIVKRNATLVVYTSVESIAIGNGTIPVLIPRDLSGFTLTDVIAAVDIPCTTGRTDVQIRRVRNGSANDMLSTKITLDIGVYKSTNGVINTSYDDLLAGDTIFVDVDAAGTNAKGLFVTLTFSR